MAQTYTLNEAADKLNLSVEEFKRRLRTDWSGKVRPFQDGSTQRFRTADIDELARSLGLGSSEELPLADQGEVGLPDEIGLASDAPAKKPRTDVDAPLKLDDSDEVFHLSTDSKGSSAKGLRPKSDSDVRLEKSRGRSADDEESIMTEEFQAPTAGGSGKLSGKSGKLSASQLKGDSGKRAGDSGKAKAAASQPPEEDSSEFELSLDADSDEFELSLAQDSSEEVSLGEVPPKAKGGSSGINLTRPADSGLSLEKRKPKSEDEEVDFELSLDAPGSGKSGKKSGPQAKGVKADSDSEFELTLEEPSGEAVAVDKDKKGDIFEATDFEIPALEDDSASEVVSLEESDTDLEASSDFDLALDEADASAEDESGSEVVALDDAGKKKKSKKTRAADDDDDGAVDLGDELEEGPSASKALRGVRRDTDEEDEDYEVSEAADEGRVAASTQWGALPAIGLIPTVIIMFFGALMAYELLHSAWGYQQSSQPTTPLVSFLADTFGMKPAQ
jgi:hypothetical protein